MNDHTDQTLYGMVRSLEVELSDVLDIEAGLGEVLLETRYRLFGDALLGALDVEAGLADLLSNVTTASPESPNISKGRTFYPPTSGSVAAAASEVRRVARSIRDVHETFDRHADIMPTRVMHARQRLVIAREALYAMADELVERKAAMDGVLATLDDVEDALRTFRNKIHDRDDVTYGLFRVIERIIRDVAHLKPIIERLFDWSDDNENVLL